MKIYVIVFQTTHGTSWVSSAFKNIESARNYIKKCEEKGIIDKETKAFIEATNLFN